MGESLFPEDLFNGSIGLLLIYCLKIYLAAQYTILSF